MTRPVLPDRECLPEPPGKSAADLRHDEEAALALYQVLRARGEASAGAEELAEPAGLDPERAARGWRRLHELGLVRVTGAAAEPVDPDAAFARAMDLYYDNAAEQLRGAVALRHTADSLLKVFRPAVVRESGEVEVEYVGDRKRRDRTLLDLTSAIRDTCDSLHPGPVPPIEVLQRSLELDAEIVRRGVRARAMYPQTLTQVPKYARYLHDLAALGVEVRLIEHAPYDMVIFDGHTAFLPGDPEDPSDSVILIRGSALLRGYAAFYEDCWLRGVPLTEAPALDEAEFTEQERTIIRLMSSGHSDDQIARRMGVNRRTVQRAVTKLLKRLNATSRFEAGLRLARDLVLTQELPEQ